MMAVMTKSWTDERLEERFDAIDQRFDAVDLRLDKVDVRLDKVDADVRELRRDMKAGFDAMNERFDTMYRLMIRVGAAIVVSLVGLIATGVATFVAQA